MLCPAVRAVLCCCHCPRRTPSPSTIPLLPACRGCIYPPEQQDLCDTSLQGDGSLPNFLTGLHKFFLPLGAGINDSTASEGFSSRSDSKICTTLQQLSLAVAVSSPGGASGPSLRRFPELGRAWMGRRELRESLGEPQGSRDAVARLQPGLSVPCVPVPLDVLVGKALALPAGASGSAGNPGNRGNRGN